MKNEVPYLLEESYRFPKPVHAYMGLAHLRKRIEERLKTGRCGSCFECCNLPCKRDHDAETYWEKIWLNQIFSKGEKKNE